MIKSGKSPLKDQIAITLVPGVKKADGGIYRTPFQQGKILLLNNSSKRKEAAWAWIAFLAEPAQQAAFHGLSGDLPARRSAWDDPALQAPRVAAFRTQLGLAVATPKLPEWERIASRIAWHTEGAVREGRELDAVLAALDADADQILEKRRSLLARRERPE